MKLTLRYFIINKNTTVMHIYGMCQQTKPRNVAIRLFEKESDLIEYAGRPLRLCQSCQQSLKNKTTGAIFL